THECTGRARGLQTAVAGGLARRGPELVAEGSRADSRPTLEDARAVALVRKAGFQGQLGQAPVWISQALHHASHPQPLHELPHRLALETPESARQLDGGNPLSGG